MKTNNHTASFLCNSHFNLAISLGVVIAGIVSVIPAKADCLTITQTETASASGGFDFNNFGEFNAGGNTSVFNDILGNATVNTAGMTLESVGITITSYDTGSLTVYNEKNSSLTLSKLTDLLSISYGNENVNWTGSSPIDLSVTQFLPATITAFNSETFNLESTGNILTPAPNGYTDDFTAQTRLQNYVGASNVDIDTSTNPIFQAFGKGSGIWALDNSNLDANTTVTLVYSFGYSSTAPASPASTAPLSSATPSDAAYVQGSQSLTSATTTVSSLEVQPTAVLTMYAGDQVTATNGLFIDSGATLQGSGTIIGNVINSGTLQILLGAQVITSGTSGGGTETASGGSIINYGNAVFGSTTTGGGGGGSGGTGGSGSGNGGGGGGCSVGSVTNLGSATFLPTNPASSGSFNGIISILGSYTQTQSGVSLFYLAGYQQASGYSFLQISGSAVLEGQIQVDLLNAFQPVAGSTFDILEATGGITLNSDLTMDLPQGFDYALVDNGTVLELTDTQAAPEPSTLGLLVGGFGSLLAFRRRR